jgi:ribose/xylose/arabinose/galactoside ABC-type transport system permease subunit
MTVTSEAQRNVEPPVTGGRFYGAPASPLKRIVGSQIALLIVLMVAVAVGFGLRQSYFLTADNLLNLAAQASVLVVAAIGANYVIGAGELDLTIGSVVALTCVLVPTLLDLGLSVPVVIVAALVVGTLLGVVNAAITLWLKVPSFLTTLGMMVILRGVALKISNQPRQVTSDTFTQVFSTKVLGLSEVTIYALVAAVIAGIYWRYSRAGLLVRAVGSSEQGSRLSGLPTNRVKAAVFMLGGACSALGGLLLLGRTLTGLADSAVGFELNAIAAVLLGGGRLGGGKGSVLGTCLAAILLTMIMSGIAGLGVRSAYQLLTQGAILVAVVLLMKK